MDDARHRFAEDEKKGASNTKDLLLTFPSDYILSSKEIYEDAGENNDVELKIVSDATNPSNAEYWAVFTVARLDVKAEKRGRVEKAEKKSKAAALLEVLEKKPSSGMDF